MTQSYPRAFIKRLYLTSFLILIVSSALSSCSSVPPYEMPKQGSTANVRLKTTQPVAFYLGINIFDGNTCSVQSYLGWLGNEDRIDNVRIGMLDSAPPSSSTIERRVKANNPLTIGPSGIFPHRYGWGEVFGNIATNAPTPEGQYLTREEQYQARSPKVCKVPTFTPIENANYEIEIDPAPDHCDITVFQLVLDPQGKVERKQVQTKPPTIFVRGLNFDCNPELNPKPSPEATPAN